MTVSLKLISSKGACDLQAHTQRKRFFNGPPLFCFPVDTRAAAMENIVADSRNSAAAAVEGDDCVIIEGACIQSAACPSSQCFDAFSMRLR